MQISGLPFVVSVTMLIINIYKSRAVTLFLIKHCIQIRRRFNCKKSLYVMYNRPFDRSMGLRIISEFLKHRYSTTLPIYHRVKKGYEKPGAFANLA